MHKAIECYNPFNYLLLEVPLWAAWRSPIQWCPLGCQQCSRMAGSPKERELGQQLHLREAVWGWGLWDHRPGSKGAANEWPYWPWTADLWQITLRPAPPLLTRYTLIRLLDVAIKCHNAKGEAKRTVLAVRAPTNETKSHACDTMTVTQVPSVGLSTQSRNAVLGVGCGKAGKVCASCRPEMWRHIQMIGRWGVVACSAEVDLPWLG